MRSKRFPIVTIIGGGSNYTAEVIRLLIEQSEILGLQEIRLMDTDQTRFEYSGKSRLEINADFASRMIGAMERNVSVTEHYELISAITGTSLVLTQIRPGMNLQRIRFELIGKAYGTIPQETNGIGGMALAALSIIEVLKIAQAMELHAPTAPMVNFSNPAGMVTQAIVNHSKIEAFGMCNIPICFQLAALTGAGRDASMLDEMVVRWYGLNHLTFFDRCEVAGKDDFDEVLRYFCWLATEEYGDLGVVRETVAWMQYHRIIAGHYVPYYLFTKEVAAFQCAQQLTRGQVIAEGEPLLFRDLLDPNLLTTPERLRNRGGTNYSKAAMRAIRGLMSEEGVSQILCCKNNGTLSCVDDNIAVEVPTIVTTAGAQPIAQEVDPRVRPLIVLMAEVQSLVVEAAINRNPDILLKAMLKNPTLPDSAATCQRMLADLFAGDEVGLFADWR